MQPYSMGLGMIVDATITIGNIIEILTIAGGILVAIVTVRNSVTNMRSEIGTMKTDFVDMRKDIKKFGDVLIDMAVTNQRLTNVEQDIRELKHGEGFIRGARGLDKEYP